jgi:hypothetical protein
MTPITVMANFNGEEQPVTVYVGEPTPDRHPLHYQAAWLTEVRGGKIEQNALDALEQLQRMALEEGELLEDVLREHESG